MKRSFPFVAETSGATNGDGSPGAHARKRAQRACTQCHERKIRCDLMRRGLPCTNCADSNSQCIVRERKNARSSSQTAKFQPNANAQNDNIEAQQQPYQSPPQNANAYRNSIDAGAQAFRSPPQNPNASHDSIDTRQQTFRSPPQYINGNSAGSPTTVWNQETRDFPGSHVYQQSPTTHPNGWSGLDMPPQANMTGDGVSMDDNFLWSGLDDFWVDPDYIGLAGLEDAFNVSAGNMGHPGQNPNFEIGNANIAPLTHHTPASSSDRSSSPTLRFMPPGHNIVPDDISESGSHGVTDEKYLEGQGCFNIPRSATLHRMMKAYFQFVHPNLPIINEADVWRLWPNQYGEEGFHLGAFSVLVLQAMFFTIVGVTSDEVIRQCGFNTRRKARATFYKRAKLLFDFQVETDPICMAQGALLLTYHAPKYGRFRSNTQWLLSAILFARVARADKFFELDSNDIKHKRTLKRLWWCCILRDRIMPLGLRRSVQIGGIPEGVNSRMLCTDDFQDEIGQSRVHDENTQMAVFQVIESACKLADALTPVLETVFPRDYTLYRKRFSNDSLNKNIQEVRSHQAKLNDWHRHVSNEFPSPISLGDTSDAVIVFANMLFVYYNAAMSSLAHHEMMLWETSNIPHGPEKLETAIRDVTQAVADTTSRTKELVQLGLAKYTPISLAAYLAHPLVLHALNVRATTGTPAEPAERRQLEIYSKVLSVLQTSYDGCDFIFDLMENILTYATKEDDNMPAQPKSSQQQLKPGFIAGSGTQYAHAQQLPPLMSNHQQNMQGHNLPLPMPHRNLNDSSASSPSTQSMAMDRDTSRESHNNSHNPSRPGSTHAYRDGKDNVYDRESKDFHRPKQSTPAPMAGWKHLMQYKPRLYLRLILHADVALCHGSVPREEDFPVQLRRRKHSTETLAHHGNGNSHRNGHGSGHGNGAHTQHH